MAFLKNGAGTYSFLTRGLFVVSLLLFIPLDLHARKPEFRKVFGSNMVLPFGRPITLSGYASPDIPLVLEVNGRKYEGIKSNAKGEWQKEIAVLSTGGPYWIKVTDSSGAGAVLQNILTGNIWLCSGQSNMVYPVVASTDQPEAYNHGHPAIRLVTVPMKAEVNPLDEFAERVSWQTATENPAFLQRLFRQEAR